VHESAYEFKPVGNQWVNVVDFLGKRSSMTETLSLELGGAVQSDGAELVD
jgi:hypothetical protein